MLEPNAARERICMRPRPPYRKLLSSFSAALLVALPAAGLAATMNAAPTPQAQIPVVTPTLSPAGGAQAAPAAPRKATPEERAEAERLEPLARAAFWANEVDIDPKDPVAGVRLASALRALGRNDEAANAAEGVLIVDPNNRDALLESARAHLAAGQGFYAIDPLNKLHAAEPKDWRYVSLLGVAYEQVSRTADAEAAWRQALQMSPDNPAILSNLAMHYAARGESSEAEQLLRKAAARPDATVQIRQNLALILGLEGKLAEAEELERQDLPPEQADANLAYLKAASSGPHALADAGKTTQGPATATR
ncbi:MAG TPA: tetratricopeptide repeat protein [Caulobacteraceae bacterium]|nr:tetratricopeptide repeat protein [Caulobacteraceae bacterium]